jgi:hypothetical protein
MDKRPHVEHSQRYPLLRHPPDHLRRFGVAPVKVHDGVQGQLPEQISVQPPNALTPQMPHPHVSPGQVGRPGRPPDRHDADRGEVTFEQPIERLPEEGVTSLRQPAVARDQAGEFQRVRVGSGRVLPSWHGVPPVRVVRRWD